MKPEETVKIPRAQTVYGAVIYWLSVAASLLCIIGPTLSVADPSNNVMNPHYLFGAIWQGQKPIEVWTKAEGGFPGGHFWLNHLTQGDGLTQFGLVVGCASAGVALLCSAISFVLERPRSWGWAITSFLIALLVLFAALGICSVQQ